MQKTKHLSLHTQKEIVSLRALFPAFCLSKCTSSVEIFSMIHLFKQNYALLSAFHAICSDIPRVKETNADCSKCEFTTTTQYGARNKALNSSRTRGKRMVCPSKVEMFFVFRHSFLLSIQKRICRANDVILIRCTK